MLNIWIWIKKFIINSKQPKKCAWTTIFDLSSLIPCTLRKMDEKIKGFEISSIKLICVPITKNWKKNLKDWKEELENHTSLNPTLTHANTNIILAKDWKLCSIVD